MKTTFQLAFLFKNAKKICRRADAHLFAIHRKGQTCRNNLRQGLLAC